MPGGKDKVPPSRDWQKVAKTRLVAVHHFHELPLCGGVVGYHDPNCAPHGPEISCVRVIKKIDLNGKVTFGASCVHLFK